MSPPTLPLPRRITRSSLARFAHGGATQRRQQQQQHPDNDDDLVLGSDIEDAVTRSAAAAAAIITTAKRRRTAAAAAATKQPAAAVKAEAASPPRRRRRVALKEDEDGEEDNDDSEPEFKVEEDGDDYQDEDEKPPTRRQRKPPPTKTSAATPTKTKTRTAGTKSRSKTAAAAPPEAAGPPPGWEAVYSLVREMRTAPAGAAANAPVDTMGCERLAEPGASPRDRRLQTLVSLMLSSQTRDATNAAAVRRLQTELVPAAAAAAAAAAAGEEEEAGNGKPSPERRKPGLNLENLLAADPAHLDSLIRQVGFHNTKTRNLQLAAALLRDRFGGDIPSTAAGLTSLPGVGPKMAHLCMSAAWGVTEGIGVDVHVHRITNLWGWHATRGPEETRRSLEAWLPRDRWHEINTLLVGLGQTVCLPVGRRCGDCDLGLAGLCRAADRGKVAEGRRKRRAAQQAKKEDADDGDDDDDGKEMMPLVDRHEHDEGAGHAGTKVEAGIKVEAEAEVKIEDGEHDAAVVASIAETIVKAEEPADGVVARGTKRRRPARGVYS